MFNEFQQVMVLLHRDDPKAKGRDPAKADGRPGRRVVTASWNGVVLAESDATVQVEGNHYFPPESLRWEYLVPSEHHTICSWKGRAGYFHVKVGERVNEDAAWYYPEPKKAAQDIKGYVAFWKGIRVR
jgi:uncharacterized protein (DUF427 family)